MLIQPESRHNVAGGMQQGLRLKKSELVEDLFNNKAHSSDARKASAARLYLSHSSQNLYEEFKKSAQEFFHKNKQFEKELQNIPLKEEDWMEYPKNIETSIKRLKEYFTWLRDRENEELANLFEKENPQEKPYFTIQALGKDAEVKKLYQEHDQRLEDIQLQLFRYIPNYYYEVNPQTYEFN